MSTYRSPEEVAEDAKQAADEAKFEREMQRRRRNATPYGISVSTAKDSETDDHTTIHVESDLVWWGDPASPLGELPEADALRAAYASAGILGRLGALVASTQYLDHRGYYRQAYGHHCVLACYVSAQGLDQLLRYGAEEVPALEIGVPTEDLAGWLIRIKTWLTNLQQPPEQTR